MKSSTKSFVLVILATLLTASGQLLFKLGAPSFSFGFSGLFGDPYMWYGLVCYGFGFLLLTFALRDGELSTIFPVFSLSFVWVLIASALFFGEAVTTAKIVGTIIVMGGVSLLGVGGR